MPAPTKNQSIRIRITGADLDTIKQAADAVPTSVSDYIRTAALEAAKRDARKQK